MLASVRDSARATLECLTFFPVRLLRGHNVKNLIPLLVGGDGLQIVHFIPSDVRCQMSYRQAGWVGVHRGEEGGEGSGAEKELEELGGCRMMSFRKVWGA